MPHNLYFINHRLLCYGLFYGLYAALIAVLFEIYKPMGLRKETTKKLHKLLPHGLIATKKWLLEQGVSRHTLDNQVKSGQLVPVATAVYSKPNVMLTWQGVVCSLQNLMKEDVLVGGITAVKLLGFGHYLSTSRKITVHLYAQAKAPSWLNKLLPDVTFVWHGTQRLWQPEISTNKNLATQHTWREDLPPLYLSSVEKAYLELLIEVPESVSFEHADEIMQGLTSLSPRKLRQLLQNCRNVKVKRLFFWFAERHAYPWIKKLNPDDFDLGSGKRLLIKGGKLDHKYQITVPEHMHG